MKNFARKSFVAALMVLPLLSHAAEKDCGGGTITAIHEFSDFSAVRISFSASMPYLGERLWFGNVFVKDSKLRNVAAAAFHSGSLVKIYTTDGSCEHVSAIAVCKDQDTCNQMIATY